MWREKRKVRIFGKGKCELTAIVRIFGMGKCKLIANFSATMMTSLPSISLSLSLSLYLSLSLSLSLSHRAYLTHNIGSASALPIISVTMRSPHLFRSFLIVGTSLMLGRYDKKEEKEEEEEEEEEENQHVAVLSPSQPVAQLVPRWWVRPLPQSAKRIVHRSCPSPGNRFAAFPLTVPPSWRTYQQVRWAPPAPQWCWSKHKTQRKTTNVKSETFCKEFFSQFQ